MSSALLKLRTITSFLGFEGRPRWAKLFLNTTCNLRCPYCAVPEVEEGVLPLDDWHPIYDRLRTWGVTAASILGGEPTLRSDLSDHIRALRERDILVTMTTNGVNVSESQLAAWAEAGLFCLQVSLDTRGDSRLPKGDPEKAFGLLESARRLHMLPVVTSVVTALNVDQVLGIADEAIARKFFFSCSPYQGMGGAFSRFDATMSPRSWDVERLFQGLLALKSRTHKVLNTTSYFKSWHRFAANSWKCDPAQDLWVAVDSRGYLLRCHEHKSPYRVADIESLDDPKWLEYKCSTVRRCPGCYYHCFFDAEAIRGFQAVHELPTVAAGFWSTSSW